VIRRTAVVVAVVAVVACVSLGGSACGSHDNGGAVKVPTTTSTTQ
jgi:hypothetical protein